MYLEIPKCKRCCFCLPLRCGIIAFGYLNLVISLFILIILSYEAHRSSDPLPVMTPYKGVTIFSLLWLPILLYVLEVLFNIILVVGAHMKQTRLLIAYYYYGLTMSLAAVVVYIVVRPDIWEKDWYIHMIESALVFSCFVLQMYLLLLIRSEMERLRRNKRHSFVNHAGEVIVNIPWGEGRNPL